MQRITSFTLRIFKFTCRYGRLSESHRGDKNSNRAVHMAGPGCLNSPVRALSEGIGKLLGELQKETIFSHPAGGLPLNFSFRGEL